jgi:hypothetical protein
MKKMNTMGLHGIKTLILFIILSLVTISHAQDSEIPSGRFVYAQTFPGGETHVVLLLANEENVFTVSPNECYKLDADLEHIAVSQQEKPTDIRIYQLDTGTLIADVVWQNEWLAPCAFGFWAADESLLFVSSNPPTPARTLVDISSGEVVAQFQLNDPASITASGVETTDFSPESLPGIMPENPLYVVSPNQDFVVYQRCLRDLSTLPSGASCLGQDEYVVFDIARQADIAILRNPPALMNDPTVHLSFYFTWSPSGRYLAYESNISEEKTIFEVSRNSYIDTSAIHSEGYHRRSQMRWSPDERRIAFLLDPRSSSALGSRAFSIFDLTTGSYDVLDGTYPVKGDEWDWLPDSVSLAVNLEDDSLLRVALDGSATLIAENVESISTSSSGLST